MRCQQATSAHLRWWVTALVLRAQQELIFVCRSGMEKQKLIRQSPRQCCEQLQLKQQTVLHTIHFHFDLSGIWLSRMRSFNTVFEWLFRERLQQGEVHLWWGKQSFFRVSAQRDPVKSHTLLHCTQKLHQHGEQVYKEDESLSGLKPNSIFQIFTQGVGSQLLKVTSTAPPPLMWDISQDCCSLRCCWKEIIHYWNEQSLTIGFSRDSAGTFTVLCLSLYLRSPSVLYVHEIAQFVAGRNKYFMINSTRLHWTRRPMSPKKWAIELKSALRGISRFRNKSDLHVASVARDGWCRVTRGRYLQR